MAARAVAVAKITDDVEVLLAVYDFPAEHWIHPATVAIGNSFKWRPRVGRPLTPGIDVMRLLGSMSARQG